MSSRRLVLAPMVPRTEIMAPVAVSRLPISLLSATLPAAVSGLRSAVEMRSRIPATGLPAASRPLLSSVVNASLPTALTLTVPEPGSAETLRFTRPSLPTYTPSWSKATVVPSMVPAKSGFPPYCVLPSWMRPWRSWSTSSANALRSSTPTAPLMPERVSSRTRSIIEPAWVSALSAFPSRARPSSMLRVYCWVCCFSARTRMALTVSTGESEGRLRRRPEDSCSWVRCRRVRLACSPSSTPRLRVWGVTRNDMSVLPSAGHVDERVERRVDRGDELRCGRIGVLVVHEVGHLLVQAHPRDTDAGVVEMCCHRGLEVALPVGALRLHAELHHQAAVLRVGPVGEVSQLPGRKGVVAVVRRWRGCGGRDQLRVGHHDLHPCGPGAAKDLLAVGSGGGAGGGAVVALGLLGVHRVADRLRDGV